jgi:hypothetical protein
MLASILATTWPPKLQRDPQHDPKSIPKSMKQYTEIKFTQKVNKSQQNWILGGAATTKNIIKPMKRQRRLEIEKAIKTHTKSQKVIKDTPPPKVDYADER